LPKGENGKIYKKLWKGIRKLETQPEMAVKKKFVESNEQRDSGAPIQKTSLQTVGTSL
jgi:hypothetical protein